MECLLKNKLKPEHELMQNKQLGGITFQCPLLNKQICLYCCLHISAIANPTTRNTARDFNPSYENLLGEDFQTMWDRCSSCANNR